MIKVRCISKNHRDTGGYSHGHPVDDYYDELDISQVYDVWCLEVDGGGNTVAYIEAVEGREFPTPYPLSMFDVIENDLPKGWKVILKNGGRNNIAKRVSFSEWAVND